MLVSPMQDNDRRSTRRHLRHATAEAHQRTERLVDDLTIFSSPSAYRRWLRAMTRVHQHFGPNADLAAARLGLEPNSGPTRDALVTDLTELGWQLQPTTSPFATTTIDAALGIGYVLEGSALGARVLLDRARAANVASTRYLELLVASSSQRWPAFVQALEREPVDIERAVDGAISVFDLVSMIMEEASHADEQG